MKKRDVILFFISSLKNRIFIAILILFLISMGGIILSTHNNFSSNNLNNKTILAQKEIKQNANDNKIDKNSISNPNLETQVSAMKRSYLNELSKINEKFSSEIQNNLFSEFFPHSRRGYTKKAVPKQGKALGRMPNAGIDTFAKSI